MEEMPGKTPHGTLSNHSLFHPDRTDSHPHQEGDLNAMEMIRNATLAFPLTLLVLPAQEHSAIKSSSLIWSDKMKCHVPGGKGW